MDCKSWGCTRRERLEVVLTALFAAYLGLMGPVAQGAGRLGWLGPVLALPVGLGLCPVWERFGERDLGTGLAEGFGTWVGRALQGAYLLWGAFLLSVSARRYVGRLLTALPGERVRWLYLGTALGLSLWLGRGDGRVLARAGRLLFLTAAAALGLSILLALPGLDWRNLWPVEQRDLAGVPGSALLALSLSGYGVYALCLPRGRGTGERGWPWAAWGCGALAAAQLAVTGAFGSGLTARLDEPFLLLLRRGTAALAAAAALADLVLLTLLTLGCAALWRGLVPKGGGWGGWILVLAAYCAAGLAPEAVWRGAEKIVPWGNLILGVFVPFAGAASKRWGKGGQDVVEKGRKRK